MMRVRTRARAYRGAETRVPTPDKTDISYDGDDAVVCSNCGASVRGLESDPDRPVAHAPGGFRTNTRIGRYKCPGSGNDGTTYAS